MVQKDKSSQLSTVSSLQAIPFLNRVVAIAYLSFLAWLLFQGEYKGLAILAGAIAPILFQKPQNPIQEAMEKDKEIAILKTKMKSLYEVGKLEKKIAILEVKLELAGSKTDGNETISSKVLPQNEKSRIDLMQKVSEKLELEGREHE